MNIKPSIRTALVLMVLTLMVAACAPKQEAPPATQPQPAMQEQPAVVPEIAQAEQSVDEIGMQELDEMEKDSDELVLP